MPMSRSIFMGCAAFPLFLYYTIEVRQLSVMLSIIVGKGNTITSRIGRWVLLALRPAFCIQLPQKFDIQTYRAVA